MDGVGESPGDWHGAQQLFTLCKIEVPDPGSVRTEADPQGQHWSCLRAQGLQLRNRVTVFMFLWHVGEKVVKWHTGELGSVRLLDCHRVSSGLPHQLSDCMALLDQGSWQGLIPHTCTGHLG